MLDGASRRGLDVRASKREEVSGLDPERRMFCKQDDDPVAVPGVKKNAWSRRVDPKVRPENSPR